MMSHRDRHGSNFCIAEEYRASGTLYTEVIDIRMHSYTKGTRIAKDISLYRGGRLVKRTKMNITIISESPEVRELSC